jgi:peptidoglycan/LPS O-acetylase OafA/YrhL
MGTRPEGRRGNQVTRANSFDDVRLAAALVVLAGHALILYGDREVDLGQFFIGALAVQVFFAVSGYLIAQSWDNDPAIPRFLARRALRVVPALLVVVLAAVFVIGPVFTTLPLGAYFSDARTWRYLSNVWFVLVRELPGVFQAQPQPKLGVNSPLWSLAFEVLMYGALLAASVTCRKFGRLVPPLLVCGWLLFTWGHLRLEVHEFYPCVCFVIGWVLYLLRDRIVWRADLGFLVFAALILGPNTPESVIAGLVALSYFAVAFGRGQRRPLRFVTRFGDLSYGTYIWAYPVQRVVNELLGFNRHWSVSLALCLVATLPIAWLSWRFVERPALSLKPAARAITIASGHGSQAGDIVQFEEQTSVPGEPVTCNESATKRLRRWRLLRLRAFWRRLNGTKPA